MRDTLRPGLTATLTDPVPPEQTIDLRETLRAIARRDDPRHPEWTTPV